MATKSEGICSRQLAPVVETGRHSPGPPTRSKNLCRRNRCYFVGCMHIMCQGALQSLGKICRIVHGSGFAAAAWWLSTAGRGVRSRSVGCQGVVCRRTRPPPTFPGTLEWGWWGAVGPKVPVVSAGPVGAGPVVNRPTAAVPCAGICWEAAPRAPRAALSASRGALRRREHCGHERNSVRVAPLAASKPDGSFTRTCFGVATRL